MGQRVSRGVRGQRRWTTDCELRVADRSNRDQKRTGDTDLRIASTVADDGHGCYFRPGAGGGWNCNDGKQGAWHFEFAVVVIDLPAAGEQQCDGLGQIETTAAADPDRQLRRKSGY